MDSFFWNARVYYEDTDAGGVVYYANYLKFMERARSEWLRALGVEQDNLMQDMNVLFAVRSISIDYKKPAKFNDSLIVSVEPHMIKQASITFKQDIHREGDETDLLTTSDVNVVCLSANDFAPCAIPKELHQLIKAGEMIHAN